MCAITGRWNEEDLTPDLPCNVGGRHRAVGSMLPAASCLAPGSVDAADVAAVGLPDEVRPELTMLDETPENVLNLVSRLADG